MKRTLAIGHTEKTVAIGLEHERSFPAGDFEIGQHKFIDAVTVPSGPQFRQQYSDQEIADVVTFIRNGWGNQAPAVTADAVAKLRKTTDPTSDQVTILKMR